MSPATHLFRIDGATATPFRRASMTTEGLMELQHLERWIVAHPEIMGGNVRIVTQQFDRWATSGGQVAADRLDVLGLDATGQLVVVELKRDGDKRVHLQAVTYAALVAGFTKETLGIVHAEFLNKSKPDTPITPEAALALLTEHVEGEWGDELLTRPRIVLIAERFPSQVLTTVSWLTELAPSDLAIQCIEVAVFREPEPADQLCATFQQIFPIDDMTDRILGPTADRGGSGVSVELAERTRRQRSVPLIVDNNLIPRGASLQLNLGTLLRPDWVSEVESWIAEEPDRGAVTWLEDRQKPLRWAYRPDVEAWSATKLAQHIVELATGQARTFSGPDAWTYQGETLFWIADRFSKANEAGAL
ncbi:hypothetical protein [Paractinoplanes lichenicola]|uniref:Endonuclease NucS n=1 Tax=Paractinoplanes lichenicola TaxID=2802976 RepID=A0ABS1VYB9_9ACTN|nr:hypothetical protein [Actinoplanes lichenicola]MBL7259478.1 hypothetical protein [Actinoplanes lichenicola]